MPELPEVETIANELRLLGVAGQEIHGVFVRWPGSVLPLSPHEFSAAVLGKRIRSISRRGKHLLLAFEDGSGLAIHFRMSGHLLIKQESENAWTNHEHLALSLSGGLHLAFHDTRKFGRWRFAPRLDEALAGLGPDALLMTQQAFAAVRQKKRMVKPLLLDQTFVAGVGNIYADESLWLAGLHPMTPGDALSADDALRLYEAMQVCLRQGIERGGTSLGNSLANYKRLAGKAGDHQTELHVFRRTGKPCPRCSTPIIRLVVAQRGTHICPQCQIKKET